MKKKLLTLALLAVVSLAQADTNPAKKELINKLLQLQQGSIEGIARTIAERPALQLMQQAAQAVQFRVAPEKRDAVGKAIQADAKKYLDEAVPLVVASAAKITPTTIGPILEAKFNEDELRQLIAFMESPVQKKYAQVGGDIQKALGEKLVAETRTQVEPKAKALQDAITKRLDAAVK